MGKTHTRGIGGTPFALADLDGDGLDDIACLHRTALGGVDYLPRVDRSPNLQDFNDARRRAGARHPADRLVRADA